MLHGLVVKDIWGTSFGIMPVTHDLLVSPVVLMMTARPLCCINITQIALSLISCSSDLLDLLRAHMYETFCTALGSPKKLFRGQEKET